MDLSDTIKSQFSSLKYLVEDSQGSIADIIMIPAVFLASFVSMLLVVTVNDEIIADGVFNASSNALGLNVEKPIITGTDMAVLFDRAFIFVIIGFVIGSALLSTQIQTHPAFLIPSFIFTALALFLSATLSNLSWRIGTDAGFVASFNQLPKSVFIINNMPVMVLAASIMINLALYARPFGQKTTIDGTF